MTGFPREPVEEVSAQLSERKPTDARYVAYSLSGHATPFEGSLSVDTEFFGYDAQETQVTQALNTGIKRLCRRTESCALFAFTCGLTSARRSHWNFGLPSKFGWPSVEQSTAYGPVDESSSYRRWRAHKRIHAIRRGWNDQTPDWR
jgi:hypothetical protein